MVLFLADLFNFGSLINLYKTKKQWIYSVEFGENQTAVTAFGGRWEKQIISHPAGAPWGSESSKNAAYRNDFSSTNPIKYQIIQNNMAKAKPTNVIKLWHLYSVIKDYMHTL